MKRSDFSNSGSEIFDLFADIVEQEKLLDKTAEYGLLPEGLFETNKAGQELDLGMAVIASSHSQLYGVTQETGEQLVGSAHPKNTKTELDNNKPTEKGLDVVETIVEQHKVNEGIATKTPSGKLAALAEHLSKLANAMDEGGFKVLADKLDVIIKSFADVGMGPAGSDAASDLDFGTHTMDEAGVQVSPAGGLTQKDVEKEINRAYPESSQESPRPAGYNARHPVPAPAKQPTSVYEGNQVAKELLGIPQASDAALKSILDQRGIRYGKSPGQYHDWNSLYALIQNSMPDAAHKNPPTKPVAPVYRGPPANRPF